MTTISGTSTRSGTSAPRYQLTQAGAEGPRRRARPGGVPDADADPVPNQDPLKPQDPAEFLTQLAQVSSVTGISEMNKSIATLADSLYAGQALQAASVVGRNVLAPSGSRHPRRRARPCRAPSTCPSPLRPVSSACSTASGALVRETAARHARGRARELPVGRHEQRRARPLRPAPTRSSPATAVDGQEIGTRHLPLAKGRQRVARAATASAPRSRQTTTSRSASPRSGPSTDVTNTDSQIRISRGERTCHSRLHSADSTPPPRTCRSRPTTSPMPTRRPSSRPAAEFADVFSGDAIGIGNGVRLTDVRQEFTQGNVDITGRQLDLAVSGKGFFIVNDNGSLLYSRVGAFGLDAAGFVRELRGRAPAGVPAAAATAPSTPARSSDLQFTTDTAPPQPTTRRWT